MYLSNYLMILTQTLAIKQNNNSSFTQLSLFFCNMQIIVIVVVYVYVCVCCVCRPLARGVSGYLLDTQLLILDTLCVWVYVWVCVCVCVHMCACVCILSDCFGKYFLDALWVVVYTHNIAPTCTLRFMTFILSGDCGTSFCTFFRS